MRMITNKVEKNYNYENDDKIEKNFNDEDDHKRI